MNYTNRIMEAKKNKRNQVEIHVPDWQNLNLYNQISMEAHKNGYWIARMKTVYSPKEQAGCYLVLEKYKPHKFTSKNVQAKLL